MSARDEKPSPGSVLYRQPGSAYPIATHASSLYISDSQNKQYLDMSGGAAVSCLGHGHPVVIDAISEQLGKLAFAHTAFFTHEPQEKLATKLTTRFREPGARVYFLSGGSEANETALKAAWQYWVARGKPDKKVVISREHSYHGNTFGALSVSGNAGRRRASAAPLCDWPRIPPCYPYREMRDGENLSDYALRAANYLEEAILDIGADSISAFICEPVVGSSLGVVPAPPGYLRRIREICDRHNVLLIADEIMCGSGRTGDYFAHERDEIVPDMVTLAKGIGGGYVPLAAVVIRSHVTNTLVEAGFTHGHTYIGHPLACAAGLAVQRVIDRDQLLTRVTERGERFLSLLSAAFSSHDNVGEIRGRGLFAGMELVANRETREGFANRPGIAEELRRAAMERGLICYPGSIEVDGMTVPHIMLAPPFIAEERHLVECVDKLRMTLQGTL